MKVPAGEHTIEFRFEPESYYLGRKLSFAGSILIILFILGGLLLNWKTGNTIKNNLKQYEITRNKLKQPETV
ncbi:MAG: hypothetical protein HC906_05150 [Bacteroidales bacterium]|nr:hypothetical protein [Bacteroidales bacterium]